MEKTWIYCRDNNENHINNQYNECLDYANTKGWEVIGNSKDIGSGLNLNRVGLNEILSAAKQGKIDVVLMKDVSRIGRNIKEVLVYIEKLESYGTKVFFVASQSEANPMFIDFISTMKDEHEKEAKYKNRA